MFFLIPQTKTGVSTQSSVPLENRFRTISKHTKQKKSHSLFRSINGPLAMEIERILTENSRTSVCLHLASYKSSRTLLEENEKLLAVYSISLSASWKIFNIKRKNSKIHSEMFKIFFATWESQTVQEALEAENSNKWIQAINKELKENETDGTICKCKNYRRNYRKKLCIYTEGWDWLQKNILFRREIWYC